LEGPLSSISAGSPEYGIVANVCEPDRCLRMGAKAWLAGGTGGEGWERFEWIANTRGSRMVRKWAPTWRFVSFRCAWLPEFLRNQVWYITGSRPEMESVAMRLESYAADLRASHPNRGFKKKVA
jgi:hypothetical protein